MSTVTIGNDTYDLRPFVEEAIVHFGFVQSDAAEWLTTELALTFNRDMARGIREGGTRITPAERVAMGLDRWDGGHLSREVWAALTDVGRADPTARFDATCGRAMNRLRSTAEARRHSRTAWVFVGMKFAAGSPAYPPCAAAAQLDGNLLSEPSILPFADCDRLNCGCSWRGVTAWELRGTRA